MRLTSFYDWIRRIYATQDDELGCDKVFELLPQYVEVETAGKDPHIHFPSVHHHLRQCPHCHDLYVALRDASVLEDEFALPKAVPLDLYPSC